MCCVHTYAQIFRLPLGLSIVFGPILTPSWGLLVPSWAHLGAILGPSWAILGPLGAILGPSWTILGCLGASWDHLGSSWGHLGAILGPSWGHLSSGPQGPLQSQNTKLAAIRGECRATAVFGKNSIGPHSLFFAAQSFTFKNVHNSRR